MGAFCMKKQLLSTLLLSSLKSRVTSSTVLGLIGVLLSQNVQATTSAANYNQISFSTEVKEVVANDQIKIALTKTTQSSDAKTVAQTLTQTINQANAIAKKYPSVKAKTGHQSAYPRYSNNGKILGFTGSISLELTSQDFKQAGDLVAELQSLMVVDDIEFRVSDTTKQQIEQKLMTQAAKRFQDEAKTVSLAFGAKDYKIVQVSLDSQNQGYYQPMAASLSLRKSAEISPQEFVGGDSQLSYKATGTIELIK